MKAQHMFGLNLSWRRVTVVFLIDVAVLVLAGRWPGDPPGASYAWWAGVGVAVLVAVLALVTCRRIPLTGVLSALVVNPFANPQAVLTEGCTPAVDHQRRYGREPVGIREHQGRLVSVVAVSARDDVPAGRHHAGAPSTAMLPVEPVARALRQFDVALDGIDIVSAGVSVGVPDETAAADADGAEAAPAQFDHFVIEHRETWLVLRMDPQRNVAAVATRDSVASTLAAATERLVHDLEGRHITAHAVTADEFTAIEDTVLAGLEPEQVRVHWGYLREKDTATEITSLWVSPHDITPENLEQLWLAHDGPVVVTVRLTPGRSDRTDVSALVRYHSAGRLDRHARAGVNRLGGRQLAAIAVSLPVPERGPGLAIPIRELAAGEHLTVPVDSAPRRAARAGAQS